MEFLLREGLKGGDALLESQQIPQKDSARGLDGLNDVKISMEGPRGRRKGGNRDSTEESSKEAKDKKN